jgi:hypothetical protein
VNAIGSAAEAVEHFLRAVRRDAKDRSAAAADVTKIRAPEFRRAIERAFYVNQGCNWASAIGIASEGM